MSGGAFATLHLLRPAVTASIRTWIGRLPYEAQERFTARALSALLNHPPGHTRLFAFAALGCALLFAVEGTGLWLGHRWAEWLTVIATGSLIPFELWELFRHPGVVKVFIVLLNIVVVWFLSAHLRAPRVVPASR